MPLYNSFFLIHKKVTKPDLRLLITELHKAVTPTGGILQFQDYGWRNTGYMVRKSAVGQFHYGRWFRFLWGGHVKVVSRLHEILRFNSGILRFITFKHKNEKNRTSFYKTPQAYKKETTEMRHPKEDYSI